LSTITSRRNDARRGHGHGIAAEIGQVQLAQQLTAVGVRIRAHPAGADRRQCREVGDEPALCVEEFVGTVTFHPRFELLEVRGVRPRIHERHLMRTEGSLNPFTIHNRWTGPALRCRENNHRPPRSGRAAAAARRLLDLADVVERPIERVGHHRVHRRRLGAFDEPWPPPVTLQQVFKLFAGNPREHGRIRNLEAVQVENRQHGTVADRVQELVRVPGGRKRPRFRLTVTDNARRDQRRVVQHRTEGVAE
jgi:hypothetical protein